MLVMMVEVNTMRFFFCLLWIDVEIGDWWLVIGSSVSLSGIYCLLGITNIDAIRESCLVSTRGMDSIHTHHHCPTMVQISPLRIPRHHHTLVRLNKPKCNLLISDRYMHLQIY